MLMSVLILGLSACEKGGDGEAGPQGERGEQGIAGVDGTKILSGTAVPAANLGAIGDFYLRRSNSVLYGPKANDGWGAGVSLKGANGAVGPKGADGTKLLSGTAAPTTSQGANGDFYFRTSTGILYGPKTSSGWGSGTSLKGPKGDKGDKGDTGNANVKIFEIGQRTFKNKLEIELPIALPSQGKGAVLVYYKTQGTIGWIPAPGPGPGTKLPYYIPDYYVRMNIFEPRTGFNTGTKFTFWLDVIDGSTSYRETVTWFNIRIVYVEGNDVTNIASAGVDLNDYNQVKAALKF